MLTFAGKRKPYLFFFFHLSVSYYGITLLRYHQILIKFSKNEPLVPALSFTWAQPQSTSTFCCRETNEVNCLILVDQIITAKVIECIMKKFSSLSHFSVSYVTGPVDEKKNESFRLGKVF